MAGAGAWGNYDPIDLKGAEDALDKTSAERAIRLAEQPRTFHPDDPILREQNFDVDVGRHIRGKAVVPSLARSGAQPPQSSSIAARPPSRNPCITGFS